MFETIEKLCSNLKGCFSLDFLKSSMFFIILLLIIVLILSISCYKSFQKNKTLNYYLDIIRTISKSLATNHEITAFNSDDEIIYSTHPHLYSTKDEFFRNLISKVTSSNEFKNFYKYFDAKKPYGVLLNESESGIGNQFKKLAAFCSVVEEQDSLIGENVSVVSLTDVSKHFSETEKIVKNYEKLEAFIDNFPFGIFYINNAGIIIGSNITFSNLLKTSRDRVIGVQVDEFIENFDKNIISQKSVNVVVKPKFSPDFKALLMKSTVPSVSSMQAWIIYKAPDVPEIQISKSENEFLDQETFIYAPVPSVITTIQGEIKALNPAFAAMIQDKVILDKNKIMKPGSNILSFIQKGSENENITDHLKQAFSSIEKPQPLEIKFTGGNIVTMAYISRIEPKNNNDDLILIQLLDISGQKILEQQFIQSQKMQAVGQLAGGIAHDFNNLLTAMIGFCDLLLQRYTQNDPSYGDVIQIKQNAGRAANLVRQLLAFSRQQTLKPKILSVTEMLVDLSSLLKRLIGANIEFQVVHGRDIWPVKVDNSQFEQVIINLAVNARDAMKNSGKLTIRTKNHYAAKEFKCVYDMAHPGDYVLIEVIDTGSGIDPEIIENIFEPFFSRKSSDIIKGTGSGTGLGLSTVYGIVNQTGGFIHVETELGKGTTFQIFLPRYVGNESIQTAGQEPVSRDLSGSETILLVEDEDAVRMFSSRALRDKGYKVLEASCGEEAIEIAQNEKFDLLITDVVMPKIDGPTLNKKLRETIKDLKTIFISGYAEDTFRQDLDKNSNIHFLQKPFTLKDLAGKVKEVISNG